MVIPGLLRLHDSWFILIVMDLEFVSDFMLWLWMWQHDQMPALNPNHFIWYIQITQLLQFLQMNHIWIVTAFTLRHVALVLSPRGNDWQGHPWLVLAAFAHHAIIDLLPDHTMRRGGRGGGRGSDDHVRVVWLVGRVVGVGILWTEEAHVHIQRNVHRRRLFICIFKACRQFPCSLQSLKVPNYGNIYRLLSQIYSRMRLCNASSCQINRTLRWLLAYCCN